MVDAKTVYDAITHIDGEKSFIQKLLIDTLNWDVEPQTSFLVDTSYEWSAADLNVPLIDQKLNGRALNISFRKNIKWGVFILEFATEKPFLESRGFTTLLRQLLKALVFNRRKDASVPSWERENLLFICTYKYRHYRFGYFKAPPGKEKTAPLAMFGWNKGDTGIRTVCEHNLCSLEWESQSQWQEAFSIEKVTKAFYTKYAYVFEGVEKSVAKANKKLSTEQLRLFTQMLFNRLMFLRFVEKKGWLKFDGRSDYLAALYAAGGIGGESFYKARLQTLFFEALAVEGVSCPRTVGETPFLNGGLFEKTDLDELVADIPDEAFEGIIGDRGLFYTFNFTVEESTPLDIEVAVDPEMLGKVFEELVTGRHESGSYYTPRPIVSFMCKEALKGFIAGKTKASPEAIERLVDEHEIVAGSISESQAQEILFYLDTIKACDPACGSGAYLLGLLQELIAVRRTLQSDRLRKDPEFLYKLKLGIIKRSLYGVDIDEFATNVAKLRLWLSLAVEADKPQPLPNLDFKIETGDSVLGPCDPDYEGADALMLTTLRMQAEQLVERKDLYATARGKAKQALFTEIKAEEAKIAKEMETALGPGIIAWHIHFAEVFMRSRRQHQFDKSLGDGSYMKVSTFEPGGFDIVLANPPYIRQELIKKIKPRLKEVFPQVFAGMADLYTYFYARSVEMLAPGGMLAFISSNKWFRATYGENLREYLAAHCTIRSITDFTDSPVFENAIAYPMIFIAQKAKVKTKSIYTQVHVPSGNDLDVKTIVHQHGRRLNEKAVQGGKWSFVDEETGARLAKMRLAGVPLKDYVEGQIYYGIKTGFNEAFVIDSKTRQKLIEEDPASSDLIKPVLTGGDIKRWRISDRGKWLIVTPIGVNIANYPAVLKYLNKWEKELRKRQDQGDHWWELRACAYYQEFERDKIVFPDIAPEARFALDNGNHYLGNTGYIIPRNDLFLLGVLNSSPVNEFYREISAQVRGGYLRFIYQYVAEIPIPEASPKDKHAIGNLVQKCLNAKGIGCEAWEKEIDERVEVLYGLK